MKPKALVLQARGTNRDLDVIEALHLAGADPSGMPLNELRLSQTAWTDFQMLVLPGGFSYADALGAGRLLGLDLHSYFGEAVSNFIETGHPVIGICNGFQALVKSGILPGKVAADHESDNQSATLTFNQNGNFECRWGYVLAVSQKCIWTNGLDELIYCPVAHGEGNFQTSHSHLINNLVMNDQVALTYVARDGSPARGIYPANPNGSVLDIAGICNRAGNVLGLMPHPENHIHPNQHPQWTRGLKGQSGLALFENGVKYAQGA